MSATSSVPPAPRGRHLSARAAILVVAVAAVVVVAFEGRSIRHSGEEMKPGWERSLVLAVGKPAGWVSDTLGLADVKNKLTHWASTGDDVSGGGPDSLAASATATPSSQAAAPITEDAFDPATVGDTPVKPAPLKRLLVTGDSMATPLDAEVARRIARSAGGTRTIRDPRLGTALSQSDLVDWGTLSASQLRKDKPNATVMFIGANEGFPMRVRGQEVQCCGRAWSTEYARRVRRLMATYRGTGTSRVYWLLLPAPRDAARQKIARSVNAAIQVAAQPFRAQVRVVDLGGIFTPGGRYRSAMPVGGRQQIVRESDGVHLNQVGASLAADRVIELLRVDYGQAIAR